MEILSLDPFLKNQNRVYLGIKILKFDTACFYACQVEDYQNIVKLSCRPLAFTYLIYEAFLTSDSHLLKTLCVIRLIESPLKMIKNAFYFTLKAF